MPEETRVTKNMPTGVGAGVVAEGGCGRLT